MYILLVRLFHILYNALVYSNDVAVCVWVPTVYIGTIYTWM